MSKYQSFLKKYRDLETQTFAALREEILNSKFESKHISGCKAIKVNVFGYVEMVIWNNNLTFLDRSGQHYTIWGDASLEDLIDILSNIN